MLGADSKAVQCDLCGAWIHVKCEGVSDEVYSKLNAVLGDLSNLAYYCESNNCISKIKQLLYACFIDKKLEATQIQFSENEECLSKHISDLSKKIADLSAKQQSLKETVQSISSQIAEPPTCMDTDVTQNLRTVPPRSALDICDEMTDRERRKYNLVVYNFSESVDRKADIKAFKDLCNTVFKLDTSICKAIRLGPKNTEKQRPLLLTFEEFDDRAYLLSHSYLLRHQEQFSKVYIVPDRTKLERTKHKKAVEELRQRRTKGETGLIIRNGIVIAKQPRTNKNAESTAAEVQNATQSS